MSTIILRDQKLSKLERYQKLSLTDSLPISYRYPIACKELSFILREAFHQSPKNLQTIIFQDTLSAFRLLPQMETQSAVSAVHLLFQSVEAALPKQKKNMAVTEFKQAMIAHKRRSKAHQVEKGSLLLPQDILVQIFSLLDMRSLVSAGNVNRSWNMAANDNCLWKSQYAVLYGDAAKQPPMGPDEDRNDKLLQKAQDTRTITDWKEAVKGAYTRALSRKLTINRGYCELCKTIVWLNNSRCPNIPGGMISEIHDIEAVTSFRVVEYLLNGSLPMKYYSSDSDSDSEGGSLSRYPGSFLLFNIYESMIQLVSFTKKRADCNSGVTGIR